MANVKAEIAPALAAFSDGLGPVVIRRDGLTAQTATAALGCLEPGARLFVLSKGAVSAGDVIWWALEQTGTADVLISTWTISPDEIRGLRRLLDRGAIRTLRLLVDFSFPRRHPAYTAELRASFGPQAVALTVCHAKVAVLVNEQWAVVIRSSANLNRNSRTEYHEVSDDRGLAAFVLEVLGEWFPPAADTWTVRPSEHQRRFAEWHADEGQAAGVQVAPMASRAARARRRTLQPATPEDARFFGDGLFDPDLRRVGLSYVR